MTRSPAKSQEIFSLIALWPNLRNLPIRFVAGGNFLYPASIGRENCVLAVIEWKSLMRVGKKRVAIGTYKPRFRTDSKNQGSLLAGAKNFSGLMGRDHGDGESSFEVPQHPDKRLLDKRAALINFFHEVNNNFSIGVRKKEVMASIPQPFSNLLMIRDHAVVDHPKAPIAAKVRMGIFRRHASMGGPARMRNA